MELICPFPRRLSVRRGKPCQWVKHMISNLTHDLRLNSVADLGTPLAGFGALLFIASDAMIAINRFRGPFPGNEQLIWITYYSAQFLILRGVERRHSRKQRAP